MCVGEGQEEGAKGAEDVAEDVDWKIGATPQQWQGVLNLTPADPVIQQFLS